MKKIHKISIASISSITIALCCLSGAIAQTPPYTYEDGTEAQSRGIIDVNGALFDSTDLEKIYTEVNGGKTAIASQMVSVAGLSDNSLKDNGIYTFEKLVNGVDSTYNNGKAATWTDIQTAADGTTLPTNFATADSVDSLATAVNSYTTDPVVITKIITDLKTETAYSSSMYPATFTFPSMTHVVGITNLCIQSSNFSEPAYISRVNSISINGNTVTVNMYHAPAAQDLSTAYCTAIGY